MLGSTLFTSPVLSHSKPGKIIILVTQTEQLVVRGLGCEPEPGSGTGGHLTLGFLGLVFSKKGVPTSILPEHKLMENKVMI